MKVAQYDVMSSNVVLQPNSEPYLSKNTADLAAATE